MVDPFRLTNSKVEDDKLAEDKLVQDISALTLTAGSQRKPAEDCDHLYVVSYWFNMREQIHFLFC